MSLEDHPDPQEVAECLRRLADFHYRGLRSIGGPGSSDKDLPLLEALAKRAENDEPLVLSAAEKSLVEGFAKRMETAPLMPEIGNDLGEIADRKWCASTLRSLLPPVKQKAR